MTRVMRIIFIVVAVSVGLVWGLFFFTKVVNWMAFFSFDKEKCINDVEVMYKGDSRIRIEIIKSLCVRPPLFQLHDLNW